MSKSCPLKYQQGFTFIEILVVVSIMGLVMVIGSLQVRTYQKHQKTEQAARDFEKVLHLTKERALSGYQVGGGYNGVLTGYYLEPVGGGQEYTVYPVVDESNEAALKTYSLSSDDTIWFDSQSRSVLFRTVGGGCRLSSGNTYTYRIINDDEYICSVRLTCPTGQIEFIGCS